MIGRGPIRPITRVTSWDAAMIMMGMGSMDRPARSGLKPCTRCRYRVRKKNTANMPAPRKAAIRFDTAIPGYRKIDSGTSGFALAASITTNPTNSTTAPASIPSVEAEAHESVSVRTIA